MDFPSGDTSGSLQLVFGEPDCPLLSLVISSSPWRLQFACIGAEKVAPK